MIEAHQLDMIVTEPAPPAPDPWQTIGRILARKAEFGITRLGSITGLDRIGIPVAQVVRPMSRSVSVNQGKGLSCPQAAISALMESLEGWASERIAPQRTWRATLGSMNGDGLWSHLGPRKADEMLSWIEGRDLFSSKAVPVPLALVDTAYTLPSPHPVWLTRNTTGLAAGTSLRDAFEHACFEVLERHARCAAARMPHFFDRFQIDSRSVSSGVSGKIMDRLREADCRVGIWSIPAPHGFPVYWCHVMENDRHAPLAPWPAEGFGCDRTHDRALAKALLEACQSRLGIISAAREDMTARNYHYQDMATLGKWREQLAAPGQPFPAMAPAPETLPQALRRAGAKALIVVPLLSDETLPLHVLRVIAPPLETDPEFQNGA